MTAAPGGSPSAPPISTSEVIALPFPQVQPPGMPFAVPDPMALTGHAPLGATNQPGGLHL